MGYDLLIPGAADRIIKMAEKQAEHRQRLEEKELAIEQKERDSIFWCELLGMFFGFIIAITCVGAAVYSIIIGANPWVTGAFLGLPTATVIRAIRGKKDKSRDKANESS